MMEIKLEYNLIKQTNVAPQIIVYNNILKDSNEIIDIIENNERVDSLWPKWEPWYKQGKNIHQLFYRDQAIIEENDSENLKKEKIVLQNIFDVYDFIKKDYLNKYNENNGKWPSYINQWDKIREKSDPIDINIYRYDVDRFDKINEDELMMQFHVDEMPENAHSLNLHQVVTITFYLNENYEGGEVCFYDEDQNKAYEYKPRTGDATAFPSSAPFYHGVNHFTGSNRYFMRIFINYSSEGDTDWIKNNKNDYNDFIKNQHQKINDFVEKYSHAVTLEFPNKKPKNIYGKLIKLDNDIIRIGND